MNRLIVLFVVVISLSSCDPSGEGKEASTGESTVPVWKSEKDERSKAIDERAQREQEMDSMEVLGLDLRMLGAPTVDGEPQRPTIWVHAERGQTNAAGHSSLSYPRAFIYDADGGEIVLTADTGDFDQKAAKSHLRGNVEAVTDSVVFTMDEITWDNGVEKAYAEDGASVRGASVDLKSDRLEIDPKTNTYRMENVTGTIQLGDSE